MSSKISRSKGKSPKRQSQSNKVYEDEEIDEIMEKITLKRPRSSYTQFCMEEIKKFKSKNKNKKIDMKTFSKECAGKWAQLSEKEKKSYLKSWEEEKIQYKSDLAKVRHYLFKDFNDIVFRPPTAYRIYLDEKLREGFESNLDPKDVKAQASREWRKMDDDQRKIYAERKRDNDSWFEKAKHIRKVTALSIFVQKSIQMAKDQHKDVPKLADVAQAWKKLPSTEKNKYKKYAEDINEERERLQDIYELVNGVKPKRPAGAFRVFLQEKAREKALHSLAEGKEMWDKLSEDEKEKYLKKAHTCKLAYKYKKMIYNKKMKRILPKRPANAYGQFLKDKKGIKIPSGEKAVQYWRSEFEKLPKDKRRKYEEKAARDKERYERKMEEYKNYVFDMPKRPLNGFSLFIKDRIPDLKKENPKKAVADLIKIAAKEWTNQEGVSQSNYEKMAEKDKKRFSRQLKEFEKLGYYKKNSRGERTKKEEDDEEEEEKPKRKMKKRRSASATKKGSKKTRSKSKSKTQEPRSKSRSKSRKSGKVQKRK